MRWWPWGERSEREVPAPAPAVEPTPPPPRDGWRSLPPTRPTVSEHEPVFKTLDFGDDLRSWHSPTFVRELRHELSPTGPIGVMSGITTTVPTASVARTIAPDAADRPVRDFHASRPQRLPSVLRSAFGGTVATQVPAASDLVRSPAPVHDPFVVPALQRSGPDGTAPAFEPAPALDDVALLGDRATATVLEPPPLVPAPPPSPEVSDRSGEAPRPPVRLGLGAPLRSAPTDQPRHAPTSSPPAPPVVPEPIAPVGPAPVPGVEVEAELPTIAAPVGPAPVPGVEVEAAPPAAIDPAAPADDGRPESRDVPLLGGAPPPTVLDPAGPSSTVSRSAVVGGGGAPLAAGGAPPRPMQRQVQREVGSGPMPVSSMGPPVAGPVPKAPPGARPGPPSITPPDDRSSGRPDLDEVPAAQHVASADPAARADPVAGTGSVDTEPLPEVPLLGNRPLELGIDEPLAAHPTSGPAPGVDPVGDRPLASVQRGIAPPAHERPTGSVPAGPGGVGAAPSPPGERADVPTPMWRSSVAVLARRPIDPVLTGTAAAARANGPTGSSAATAGVLGSPASGSVLGAVQRQVIAEPADPEARAVFDPIPVAPSAVPPLALNVPRPSTVPSPAIAEGGVRRSAGPAAIPPGTGPPARSAVPVLGSSGPVPGGGVQRSAVSELRSERATTPRGPWPETIAPMSPAVSWEGREVLGPASMPAGEPPGGGGGPWVQREGDGGEVPTPAEAAPTPAAPTATVSVGGPAPAGSGSGLIGSDDQIDQLAKRLYPRIRDRIRIEARLDRERSGRALDVQR